jgi:hypothetical protein
MNRWQQAANEFAQHITRLGFQVYLAKSGEYGFITDSKESRVLCFSFSNLAAATLSGNYGPPSAEAGTGWGMEEVPEGLTTAEQVKAALYAYPPNYCQGWKYLTNVEQHLNAYQSSSQYTIFEGEQVKENVNG